MPVEIERNSQYPGSRPKVYVIIPARNEEASIGLVLDAIPSAWVDQVIVVDNGSSDRTVEEARFRGALVVTEPNPGYGRACLAGIAALPDECEIVVFLDADYSDRPEELPFLLAPILERQAEFVIGSRILGSRERGALLPQARIGNALACQMIRWLFGVSYTDLGPFRAVTRKALCRMDMRDQTFGWTVEMQTKAAVLGIPTHEVPVSYRKRVGTSKITGTLKGTISAGVKIIFTIIRIAVNRVHRCPSTQERKSNDIRE